MKTIKVRASTDDRNKIEYYKAFTVKDTLEGMDVIEVNKMTLDTENRVKDSEMYNYYEVKTRDGIEYIALPYYSGVSVTDFGNGKYTVWLVTPVEEWDTSGLVPNIINTNYDTYETAYSKITANSGPIGAEVVQQLAEALKDIFSEGE